MGERLADDLMRPDRCRTLAIAAVAAVLFLSGCARDYVSGQPTLSLLNDEQEVALGKQQDAKIVAEYGLYDDPELAAYVDGLGQSLAAVSQRTDIAYHYRVLDDDVVNAFALPGGYIYVPRGILAFFNSEDQLVGVMAHETGHVVARHGVEQMSQRVLVTGFGLTDRLAEAFPIIGGIATAPINLGLLSYSRDQESESDRLGVEYATRIGHDASALADFFHTLGAMSAQSDHEVPTYLSTHPHPDDRFEKVNSLTDEWQDRLRSWPAPTDPAEYLRRIDGIVYGKDPRHGFTADGYFYHPSLDFQFPVPEGWQLSNTASRLVTVSADETALVQMTLAAEQSVQSAAAAFLESSQVELVDRREHQVNGLPAIELESVHVEGRERTRLRSLFVELSGVVLAAHGLAAERDYPVRAKNFDALFGGVSRIAEKKIRDIQPRRVHVTRAPVAGDLESVLRALDVADDELQAVANLNGRSLAEDVDLGAWLKVVR